MGDNLLDVPVPAQGVTPPLPGVETREIFRQIWNAAISFQPAEVVRCGTVDQVRAALATAAARQLPVSVLGGGHDWAGRAIRPGGLVIDLTPMRHVQVTGDIATVAAEPGRVMSWRRRRSTGSRWPPVRSALSA